MTDTLSDSVGRVGLHKIYTGKLKTQGACQRYGYVCGLRNLIKKNTAMSLKPILGFCFCCVVVVVVVLFCFVFYL